MAEGGQEDRPRHIPHQIDVYPKNHILKENNKPEKDVKEINTNVDCEISGYFVSSQSNCWIIILENGAEVKFAKPFYGREVLRFSEKIQCNHAAIGDGHRIYVSGGQAELTDTWEDDKPSDTGAVDAGQLTVVPYEGRDYTDRFYHGTGSPNSSTKPPCSLKIAAISASLNEENGQYDEEDGERKEKMKREGLECIKRFLRQRKIKISKGFEQNLFTLMNKIRFKFSQRVDEDGMITFLTVADVRAVTNSTVDPAILSDGFIKLIKQTGVQPDDISTAVLSDTCVLGDETMINLTLDNEIPLKQLNKKILRYSRIEMPETTKQLFIPLNSMPDVLVPTGAISKPAHLGTIRCLNDLRKNGETWVLNKLHAIYLQCYKSHSDTWVSYALSRAFAMIQNDRENVHDYLDQMLKMAVKAENSSLLVGRIYLYKGYIALLDKDCHQALNELKKARCFLHFFKAGETKAWLCYLCGVAYKILAGEQETPDEYLEQQSLYYFHLYLQHTKIKEEGGFFDHRGVLSVMLKIASILLRNHGKLAESNVQVNETAIQNAKECLKYVERGGGGGGSGKDELHNLKSVLSKKETHQQDLASASMSSFKNNLRTCSSAADELKDKISKLEVEKN